MANTRIEVVYTDLLCNCCGTVAATNKRARELEARCDTDDMIRQQQHQASSRANKIKIKAETNVGCQHTNIIHRPVRTYMINTSISHTIHTRP